MKKHVFLLTLIPALVVVLSAFTTSAQTNTFPASGDVGIGTTSPTTNNLVIYSTSGIDGLDVINTNTGSGAQSAVRVGNATTPYMGVFGWSPSGAFSNGDAFIYATTGVGLRFYTNNGSGSSTAMAITTSGLVGIGTTSPSDLLDVNGAIGITTTTATKPLNGLYSSTTNSLSLTTSGVQALTITSTGSVGVGTASPTSNNIVLYSNSNSPVGIDVTNPNTGTGAQAAVRVGDGTSPYRAVLGWSPSGSYSNGYAFLYADAGVGLKLYTNGAGGSNSAMTITTSGLVGIGTSSPSDMLDISGGMGFTTTTATVPTNGIYSPSANQLNFTTDGAAALSISASGLVGIGTTSPAHTLDVQGTSYFTNTTYPVIQAQRVTSTTNAQVTTVGVAANTTGTAANGFGPVLTFSIGTSDGVSHCLWDMSAIRNGGDNQGDLVFNAQNPADVCGGFYNERMRITNAGNVGIGTTAPAQALEVNGEVKVDTFASASATTVCENGNVLSSCSSSIRYKEKVKPAQFGLNEVMEMRPVTFKWKGRDEQDLGLIAEDVETVNPLFVTYKNGEVEGVKYPQLTAVLIRAVQEQQAEIDDLKETVKELSQK